ncbi:MAG: GNAT family N-acetyltransferase [Betaproteobacteria bacterium]|nr:GNAT family N-acetyltransferase [Betaproteobacteria bacterium]
MNNELEIRALRETEAEELVALAREIWRAHYPGIISVAQIEYMLNERYSAAVIREELRRGDAWWDVLWADGVMQGYVSYFWHDGARDTIKIDKLYLRMNTQRRGYGGALLEHAARRMAGAGCKRLMLAVNRHNKTAIAAYHKNGFYIADTSLKPIGGGFWMDDYIMVKDLKD